MKRTFKKAISVFLVVTMLLCAAPMNGFVGLDLLGLLECKVEAATNSGECGDNLIWTYDLTTKTLTISGSGAMHNYQDLVIGKTVPWRDYRNEIKNVVIGKEVTTIGEEAFIYCTAVSDVIIGDCVTEIGNRAFKECTSLSEILIPDNVVSIGVCAFHKCSSLAKLTIGNSVKTIEDEAFADCDTLESVIIPDSVISIGEDAFYGSGISEVIIGDGVTTIGKYAFSSDGLKNVTIGDSVIEIENYAFYACSSLENVYIKDLSKWCAISFNDVYSNPMYYADNLVINGKISSGEVVIPDAITQIPCGTFRNSYITKITIPNSVLSIGDYAFDNCGLLSEVNIGNSVLEIGKYAFSYCDSLTTLNIPDSVLALGNDLCYSCKALKNITIGNSVIEIGNYAFAYCELTNVKIPNSVSSIGSYAFYFCKQLSTVTLGSSVKEIGNYAFYYCNALERIVIPDSVTEIGTAAFGYCHKLNSVVIGKGIIEIPKSAFIECYGVNVVVLPESIQTIANYAFKNCNSIKDVCYSATREQWATVLIGTNNESLYDVTVRFHYDCTSPNFNKKVFKQPTCFETGQYTYTCNCGKIYTEAIPITNHIYRYILVKAPTVTESGSKKQVCTGCGEETGVVETIPATGFETTNGMVVDYANNIVYGLDAGVNSLDIYTNIIADGYEWTYTPGQFGGFGTGTKATLKKGDTTVAEYTILIYGDLNGDGWYDGEDAFLANLIVKGMLKQADLPDYMWKAADSNHDGEINEADVDLLMGAGLKKNDIDQNASQSELSTQAAYIEYMSIIDQSAGPDIEPDTDETQQGTTTPETNETVEPDEPAEDSYFGIFISKVFLFIRKIFNSVFSFVIK